MSVQFTEFFGEECFEKSRWQNKSKKFEKKRIFFDEPERGDIIVFKTPSDNRTDYIKRLIGGPGDKIQFIDGNLYLNSVEIFKSKIKSEMEIYCGGEVLETNLFEEKIEKQFDLKFFLQSFQN